MTFAYVCGTCGHGWPTMDTLTAHMTICGEERPEPTLGPAPKTINDVVEALQFIGLQIAGLNERLDKLLTEDVPDLHDLADEWRSHP